MTGIPTTISAWWAVARMDMGALLGWMVTPVLWLVAGPARWVALVNTMAAQESGYNPDAVGDSGSSVGILQFYGTTWADLASVASKDPTSPCWSGFAAARYVRAGLWSSVSAWWMAVPVVGVAAMRRYWTYGQVDSISAAWSQAMSETNTLSAAAIWTLVRAAVLVPLGLAWARRRSGK